MFFVDLALWHIFRPDTRVLSYKLISFFCGSPGQGWGGEWAGDADSGIHGSCLVYLRRDVLSCQWGGFPKSREVLLPMTPVSKSGLDLGLSCPLMAPADINHEPPRTKTWGRSLPGSHSYLLYLLWGPMKWMQHTTVEQAMDTKSEPLGQESVLLQTYYSLRSPSLTFFF